VFQEVLDIVWRKIFLQFEISAAELAVGGEAKKKKTTGNLLERVVLEVQAREI